MVKINNIKSVLKIEYPQELAYTIISIYEKAVKEYKRDNWQGFGNEIDKFIDIARRMIDYQLDSKYTPIDEKNEDFTEKTLADWENSDIKYSQVYRTIIPHCLYSMYLMRNSRGIIHENKVNQNKMDATFLLYSTKWILAEFFRILLKHSLEENDPVINAIMSKESPIIWNTGTNLRVLDVKMSPKNKVLCLLYVNNNQIDTELQNSMEYKNSTDFRMLLKKLHNEKLIEYINSKCIISPLGIEVAEKILSE